MRKVRYGVLLLGVMLVLLTACGYWDSPSETMPESGNSTAPETVQTEPDTTEEITEPITAPETDAETEPPETTAPETTASEPEPPEPVREFVATSATGAEIWRIDGVTYVDGILIANKTYALPSSYNPGADAEAQAALQKLMGAAWSEGISYWVISGFRSYSYQTSLYNSYVAKDGRTAADTYSARPGHSEHQTGLAFDLNSVDSNWGETREGKWLAAHCHEYGFIIRYPKGKADITGYKYEPWHIRYLGVETAKAVVQSGLTLEEYLGITSCYA